MHVYMDTIMIIKKQYPSRNIRTGIPDPRNHMAPFRSMSIITRPKSSCGSIRRLSLSTFCTIQNVQYRSVVGLVWRKMLLSRRRSSKSSDLCGRGKPQSIVLTDGFQSFYNNSAVSIASLRELPTVRKSTSSPAFGNYSGPVHFFRLYKRTLWIFIPSAD